jgi:hypothetical protein
MMLMALIESAQDSLASSPLLPSRTFRKESQSGLALMLSTLYPGSISLPCQGRRCACAHACTCISPPCSCRYLPGRTAHLNSVLTPFTYPATHMPRVHSSRVSRRHAVASVRLVMPASPARHMDAMGTEEREERNVCACASNRRATRDVTDLPAKKSERLELWQRALFNSGHSVCGRLMSIRVLPGVSNMGMGAVSSLSLVGGVVDDWALEAGRGRLLFVLVLGYLRFLHRDAGLVDDSPIWQVVRAWVRLHYGVEPGHG